MLIFFDTSNLEKCSKVSAAVLISSPSPLGAALFCYFLKKFDTTQEMSAPNTKVRQVPVQASIAFVYDTGGSVAFNKLVPSAIARRVISTIRSHPEHFRTLKELELSALGKKGKRGKRVQILYPF
jgi:hypothetical protein